MNIKKLTAVFLCIILTLSLSACVGENKSSENTQTQQSGTENTPTTQSDEDLDYGNSQSRSSAEMNDPSARPEISGSVENMEQYDVVLIGYPIWWGEAPRIMSTFIESYDFSGKTLAAFCTSASSGFGNSDSLLRSAAKGTKWLEGHRFSAGASADEVLAWADGLKIN